MPWGTLDLAAAIPERARSPRARAWTGAAFQEHRTGVACAATLRALLEARAPLDLIALASRFPLDEMVHVELCARMAMECGGGTEIRPRPDARDPRRRRRRLPPLLRAGELRGALLLRRRGALDPAPARHLARRAAPAAARRARAHREGRGGARRLRLHRSRLGRAAARRGRARAGRSGGRSSDRRGPLAVGDIASGRRRGSRPTRWR